MAGVEIPFPQRDLHLKSVNTDDVKAFPQATMTESSAFKKYFEKMRCHLAILAF